ncbi:MAG: SsrA-binding protein SmpB [Fibrobacter sp.]|nr:SsrA-binding protein SmpB [Fibrobacter sp.]
MTAKAPTIRNRKALHNYFVEERFEVGIVLRGTEIKSIRESQISLAEAWVDVSDKMELWLVGAHINEYKYSAHAVHDSVRRRKLLAHRHEIVKMHKAVQLRGLTIVPLKLYFKNRRAKLEIGICRGKGDRDRRQDVFKREAKREMDREMKRANFR